MNIAILGATGKFGISLTAKLLAVTDHRLTLISTSAGLLYEDNHRITAKSVNALDFRALKKALKDQNLVYLKCERILRPLQVGDEFHKKGH